MSPKQYCMVSMAGWLLAWTSAASGKEDIEFVAEHLAEAAMDNRFGALPVWSAPDAAEPWTYNAQFGYAETRTGNLKLDGPMLSIAVHRELSSRWSVGAFGFLDSLAFSGNADFRPVQTSFAPGTPIARPIDARFDHLDGRLRDLGGGLQLAMSGDTGFLGSHRWIGGVLWQRVELRDYRLDYRVLAGPSNGVAGQIDFDSDYTHFTSFVGAEFPRAGVRWSVTPHVLFAWPYPTRGVKGHITGPGFDLRGDTAEVGAGKHFGDPSLTIGLDLTYLPLNLTVDVGSLITERLLEPLIHKGIDSNWLLNFRWSL